LQRRPKLILLGMVVLACPWILIAALNVLQFVGSHGERLRSDESIISAIAGDPYWEWPELERRLKSGSLGKAQTSEAVTQFANYMERNGRFGYLLGGLEFFQSADAAGAVDGAQFYKLAQAVVGVVPNVGVLPEVRSNQSNMLSVYFPQQFRVMPGCQTITAVRGIWLSNDSVSTTRPADAVASDTTQPSGPNYRDPQNSQAMVATNLPPGAYQATFLIDVGILPATSAATMAPPGQAPLWPTARARWTATVKAPVTVLPAYVYQPTNSANSPPPFRVETDPKLDPQVTGAITIRSAQALCYTDRTVVIVWLNVTNLAAGCYLDGFIKIAGKVYPGGQAKFYAAHQPANPYGGFSCELGPLPQGVHMFDLILRPNMELAAKTWLDMPWWGRPMEFVNYSLNRRECNFSLIEARQKQWARDAAATQGARK
jgi:hypothetical protein